MITWQCMKKCDGAAGRGAVSFDDPPSSGRATEQTFTEPHGCHAKFVCDACDVL
jgi:hypothetical protein